MQVEIKIDDSYSEPKIVILTASVTEEVNHLMQKLSDSEIINLKKVKSFDLSFTGTIYVELMDGTTTYVSRRYVSKIKKILGM